MCLPILLYSTEAAYVLTSAEMIALEGVVEASQSSVCCIQRFVLSITGSIASRLSLLDFNLHARRSVPFTTPQIMEH